MPDSISRSTAIGGPPPAVDRNHVYDLSPGLLAAENDRLRARIAALEARYVHVAQQNYRLEQQVVADSMTGLANHRAFHDELRAELILARRLSHPLALLMVDVDDFKLYNDAYGHPAGDEVLKTVSNFLRMGTRVGDFVARYGGEEFAVILPATEAETAVVVADRLRCVVAGHEFPHRSVTISVGVAVAPEGGIDPHRLVADADEALYRAKGEGRNCIRLAEPGSDNSVAEWTLPPSLVEPEGEGLGGAAEEPLRRPAAQFDSLGGLEGILQEAAGPVLDAILSALDMRDNEYPGHPRRVARYSLRLAAEVAIMLEERRREDALAPALAPSDLRDLAIGSLLHDIGNIRMPDHILRKATDLSPHEVVLLRRHPRIGAAMIGDLPVVEYALPVVKYHHERWDGEGYPYGLAGESIPMTARIFSVCDALDSMTTDQPYRKKLCFAEARAEIGRNAGRQFDPTVVTAFMRVPDEEWQRLQEGAAPDEAENRAA